MVSTFILILFLTLFWRPLLAISLGIVAAFIGLVYWFRRSRKKELE
jgi:hypothetical protein